MVGHGRHGGVARQEGHAFRQVVPPESPPPTTPSPATDFEFVRIVDDGLDSQDAAVLVVHVDPVSLQGDGLSRPLVRRYWPELDGRRKRRTSLALPALGLDNA